VPEPTLREQYGQALYRWGLLDEVNDPAAAEEFAVTDLLSIRDAELEQLRATVARVRQALVDADWGGPDRDDVITEIRAALDQPGATA
jgi:hypothetical protein